MQKKIKQTLMFGILVIVVCAGLFTIYCALSGKALDAGTIVLRSVPLGLGSGIGYFFAGWIEKLFSNLE